jgi:hypothetical protein
LYGSPAGRLNDASERDDVTWPPPVGERASDGIAGKRRLVSHLTPVAATMTSSRSTSTCSMLQLATESAISPITASSPMDMLGLSSA